MLGLGMPELIVIMLVVMLMFGAKRLPEIGGGLGKGIKNFKEQLSQSSTTVEQAQLPEGQKENG
ncbi:MAG: twin-arginine translocase TatA/TatE family subunit [Nitrospinae bacterium]|nr:twin-arginine translocase TatA/TatE family subunit [Nitrospinota bacterium]